MDNNSTFSEAKSTEETWKFYQRKSRPVFSFMEECITITDDETEKATIEEMYAALKEWLKQNNIKLRIGRHKMIRDLRDEGLETRQKREDERKRMYYGVTLSRQYLHPTPLKKGERDEIERKREEGNKKRVTACQNEMLEENQVNAPPLEHWDMTGKLDSQRANIHRIMAIIGELEDQYGGAAPIEEVMRITESEGIKRSFVQELIDQEKQRGHLYEPKEGMITRAVKG